MEQREALKLLLALVFAYLVWVNGWPQLLHWMIHRFNWTYGKCETWRRPTDRVLMVGFRCPKCGRLTGVHPDRGSYKRMMRGSRWF